MSSQREELILESMEEAMSRYIQFIEEKFANDAVRQAEEYRNMLPGSWGFPAEFSLWRDRCSGESGWSVLLQRCLSPAGNGPTGDMEARK